METDFLGVGRGRGRGRGIIQTNPAFWNENDEAVAPGGAGGRGRGRAGPHPYFAGDVALPLLRVRETRELSESSGSDVASPATRRRALSDRLKEVEENSPPGYRSSDHGVIYADQDWEEDDYPPGLRSGEYNDMLMTGPAGPSPQNSEAPRHLSEGSPVATRGTRRPEQPAPEPSAPTALSWSNPIPAGVSTLALPPGAKTGWGPDNWTAPGPRMGPSNASSNYSNTKKKKKVNGYLLYCQRRRSEIERETGTKMSESLPELLSRFDSEWKEMAEDQKDVWKERAKEQNARP